MSSTPICKTSVFCLAVYLSNVFIVLRAWAYCLGAEWSWILIVRIRYKNFFSPVQMAQLQKVCLFLQHLLLFFSWRKKSMMFYWAYFKITSKGCNRALKTAFQRVDEAPFGTFSQAESHPCSSWVWWAHWLRIWWRAEKKSSVSHLPVTSTSLFNPST